MITFAIPTFILFFFLNCKSLLHITFPMQMKFEELLMISLLPLILSVSWEPSHSFSTHEEKNFYKIFIFLIFSCIMFCFISPDMISFLISMEGCTILMFFFILKLSKAKDKIFSSVLLIILNVSGSIPFMYSCSMLEGGVLDTPMVSISSVLSIFFVGLLLCFKIPLFMIHFWLTKAHVSASGVGSVILASLVLKIGGMGVYKWFKPFDNDFFWLAPAFVVLGLVGSVVILIVMNRMFDMKYVVACSSVVHMSFIFPFMGSMESLFLVSSFLMMVGHALTSGFLFLLLTISYESFYGRSSVSNKSLESSDPLFVMFFFFWLLLNMGFPPFLSFICEVYFLACLGFLEILILPVMFVVLMMSGKFFLTFFYNLLFQKKLFLSLSSSNMFIFTVSINGLASLFLYSFF